MKADIVLEGGGVKIPGLVGALAGIEDKGFTPHGLAGTSAGSIVAAMRAVGYTPEDMEHILYDMDFADFKDGAPFGTKLYHILKNKGVYKGDMLYNTMREFMEKKGVKNFGDLNAPLKVYSADVSNGRIVKIPDDMRRYGIDPDRVEIAWAVRTSMSIPFFFRPVKVEGSAIGMHSYFVDGGLLSNFPIDTFDVHHRAPEWPTFGVMLWEEGNYKWREVDGVFDYLGALFNTVLSAHDRRLIRSGDYENRTIRVPVGNTKTTDFDISPSKKAWLVAKGYTAASDFLKDWEFDDYVKWAVQERRVK